MSLPEGCISAPPSWPVAGSVKRAITASSSNFSAAIRFVVSSMADAPFDAKGGLGRMHQLFGEEMDTLLDEMNEALAA
ncbi:MAG: hypothetical protein HQM07_02685 [Zetaproteobacteria bacterium]|nr:hypothetical protein [Zetaproteobacteria bacterium]